jgi:hypothetical protein
MDTDGRIFKLVLNAANPLVVDAFSVVAEGGMRLQNADPSTTTLVDPWSRAPDNLDAGSNSLMLQGGRRQREDLAVELRRRGSSPDQLDPRSCC